MKYQIFNVSAEKILKAVEIYKKCAENGAVFDKNLLSITLNQCNETSRNAIGAAKQLNLFELKDEIFNSSREEKVNYFRINLLEYKPFVNFLDLISAEYTQTDAINLVKNIFQINKKNVVILRAFVNWGKFAGIFENKRGVIKLKDKKEHSESNNETNVKKIKKMNYPLCFVIMSFSDNPSLKNSYKNVIHPVVTSFGFNCERIDEQEFNDHITTRILENLKNAHFIISDLTEARPNCYYELGIAHTLNKKVIHISNSISDIHFDVKDFNFIIYSDETELKKKLVKRIRETIAC